MKIIIANSNQIHKVIEQKCINLFKAIIINDKNQLTAEELKKVKPDYIFFLHWSYVIPKDIFEKFNCILFHMTDLPYGRGGSPLQNLILNGNSETMISAIKVTEGIDTGPVFFKKSLSLAGTAEEIFLRCGKTMLKMIEEILTKGLEPLAQQGEGSTFKRRKPEESNIQALSEIETVYDFIRMLDADGYPRAFVETEFLRFEFSRASIRKDGIIADVKIIKK
jgi:methionyl-tRNA formyltransferase